jgi:hypothetical protein
VQNAEKLTQNAQTVIARRFKLIDTRLIAVAKV